MHHQRAERDGIEVYGRMGLGLKSKPFDESRDTPLDGPAVPRPAVGEKLVVRGIAEEAPTISPILQIVGWPVGSARIRYVRG